MARFELSSRLSNDLTFTRGSSANYFDGGGVQKSAGNNVARFDHHPTTLRCLGLLVQDFDDVAFKHPELLSGEHTYEIQFYIPENRNTESYVFQANDDAQNNVIELLYGTDFKWHVRVETNGVQVADLQSSVMAEIIGHHAAVILIRTNDFKFYLDGALIDSDDTGGTPGPYTQACLGQNAAKASRLDGHILSIDVSPPRTDASMVEISANMPSAQPPIPSLAVLRAHWDVSDNASVTEDVGISVLADQTANNYDLVQATGTLQPLLVAAQQNGLDVARFDGVDDLLTADAVASLLEGTDIPWSMVMVAKLNTTSLVDGNTIWSCGNSVNTTPQMRIQLRQPGSENSVRFRLKDDAGLALNVDDGAATLDTDAHVFMWVFNGTEIDMYKDGVLVTDDANADVGQMTYNLFTLGAYRRSTVSSWTDIDVGEFRIYQGILYAADIASLETELGSKWGITIS